MRPVLLSLALLALTPAAASAAPFGELPPVPVYGDATCLRATGTPGELVRSSPAGARFVHVSASGVSDGATVVTGVADDDCPQVATQPGGAGVIAQAGANLWVATRDPGADWTGPAKLDAGTGSSAVAVAPSGAAVVVWTTYTEPGAPFAVKASSRLPGTPWSAPQVLATASSSTIRPSVRAGIAADGGAVALWTTPSGDTAAVKVATASAGGAFAGAQTLGESASPSLPALAVAADGRALAAFWGGRQVQVAERAPGAAFAAATHRRVRQRRPQRQPVARARRGRCRRDRLARRPQRRRRRRRTARRRELRAPAVARGSGALSPLSELGALLGPSFGPIGSFGVSPDTDGGGVRAVLTAAGTALFTWRTLLDPETPRFASIALTGGHLDTGTVGARVRDVGAITPLLLADGRGAIGWADDETDDGKGGRLHAAVDGIPATSVEAPAVKVGEPLQTFLKPAQALRLPIVCDAACDVRVDLPSQFDVSASASLPAAGRTTLTLKPELGPVVPARHARVHVVVRFAAPRGGAGHEVVKTYALSRPRRPRAPRVLDLRAARKGHAVVVSWRTDIAADEESFFALGSARGGSRADRVRRRQSRRRQALHRDAAAGERRQAT